MFAIFIKETVSSSMMYIPNVTKNSAFISMMPASFVPTQETGERRDRSPQVTIMAYKLQKLINHIRNAYNVMKLLRFIFYPYSTDTVGTFPGDKAVEA